MTSLLISEHAAEIERQVVQAFRALLRTPLMGAEHEDFALVRRHADTLAKRFREELGYELVIRGTHARLRKQPVSVDATRPLRVTPPGKDKPAQDRWRPFTRRHYTLFALALAALERTGPQTTIALLANDLRSLAREEAVPLDFENRTDRRTLAEAVGGLEALGVLRLVSGDAGQWVRGSGSGEISLYDVERGLLADLLVCRNIAVCRNAADVVAQADDYPPTSDGRNRRARHRVARRLVEEPVLYLDELEQDEHDYYVSSQRPHLEGRLAEFTGWQIERRAEGTALVEGAQQNHALTDLRFPFQLAERQAALLLCDDLTQAHIEGHESISRGQLLRRTRGLLADYHTNWGRDTDGESVALLLTEALDVLSKMKLARIDDDGSVRPLPAIARFCGVQIVDPSTRGGADVG